MRRVWRLCRRRYATGAFDGEGARRFGGRWNPPGVRVVYASESISLAALEALVHVDPAEAPDDLVVIPVDVPGRVVVAEIALRVLPGDWRSSPGPARLQALGADWVRAGKTAILSVPSVVVPEERNYLFNPAHPDFAHVKRGRPKAFSLDPRLFG
jgi:RES domain-containing protein